MILIHGHYAPPPKPTLWAAGLVASVLSLCFLVILTLVRFVIGSPIQQGFPVGENLDLGRVHFDAHLSAPQSAMNARQFRDHCLSTASMCEIENRHLSQGLKDIHRAPI